jgi:hypothetical protein
MQQRRRTQHRRQNQTRPFHIASSEVVNLSSRAGEIREFHKSSPGPSEKYFAARLLVAPGFINFPNPPQRNSALYFAL